MILSADQIINILVYQFPGIRFLEDERKALERYENKNILVFETGVNDEPKKVIKFYSLQTFHSYEKQQKEISAVNHEIETIRSFKGHPNIVEIYQIDELWDTGQLIGVYVVMEKLPMTMTSLLQPNRSFSDQQVLDFLYQMDQVLTRAHYELPKPIIHSDIKPSNIGIRIKDNSSVDYVLMDFDVAIGLERKKYGNNIPGLSNKGSMKGLTPTYAPPEQIMAYLNHSSDISNRADVYSTGAIAMQMLTGVAPYTNSNTSFYQLPWDYLRQDWMPIFQALCNSNAEKRPRRIKDVVDFSAYFQTMFTSENEFYQENDTHGHNFHSNKEEGKKSRSEENENEINSNEKINYSSEGITIKSRQNSGIRITPRNIKEGFDSDNDQTVYAKNQNSSPDFNRETTSDERKHYHTNSYEQYYYNKAYNNLAGNASEQKNPTINYIGNNKSRADLVKVVFGILFVVTFVSLIVNMTKYRLIDGSLLSLGRLEALEIQFAWVGVVNLIVAVLCGIFFIMWFRRAYFNLHQLKVPGLKYSEGWAAGSWFVPIISWFYPYQIMRDIWRGTFGYTDPQKAQQLGLIGLWWGLFLLSLFIEVFAYTTGLNVRNLKDLQSFLSLTIASEMINLAAIVVTVMVVMEVCKGEERLIN